MDLKDKHILIVGGAGFIGSHLVDRLADCRLTVLDDFSTGSRENLQHHRERSNIQVVDADVRDPDVRRDVLRNADVVFHLACRNVRHSIGNPRENHDVNATATLDLLQDASDASVQRFIYISSSEVYGTAQRVPMDEDHPCRPETVYGAAKLAGESYTRAYYRTYGLATVVVRPFNNFGPRSHFGGDSGEVIPRFVVWALNDQPPVIFGDGTQTRDFIYVEETAEWLCRIAECDSLVGRTINLGSGTETSVQELAEIVYDETGRSDLRPQFQPPRPGDVARHCADAGLARKTIQFEVRIGVREGVRRLIDHLRATFDNPQTMLEVVGRQNWKGQP